MSDSEIIRQEKIATFHAEITKALAMVDCLRCQGDITQDTENEFVRLLEKAESVFVELVKTNACMVLRG